MLTGIERFDSKVFPDPNSGCWLWGASTHKDGYGFFGHGGKIQLAHRVSWLLHVGPIQHGLHVLHKCHNPPCVNPRHLYLGTHQQNMRDKEQSGRVVAAKGEENGSSRLRDIDVIAIRNAVGSNKKLALRFGVGASTIQRVRSRTHWKHING